MIKTPLPRLGEATAPLRARVHVPIALTYPDYRNYWFGMLASVTGFQMLVLFSLGWLVSQELDADARYLGYVSVTIAVPAIVLNLLGGVFADKLNPKRVIVFTQSITAVVALAIALLTVLDVVTRWHVLVAAFLIGTVQAFDNPTRQSIFPRLVERKALYNAIALNSAIWTGTRIIGPTMAGIIVGRASISTAIFVSAAGFVVLALVSRTLKLAPVERARGNVLTEMKTGFQFIKRNRIFVILIGMTFFNGLFGMSYVFLMPVFAKEVLEVGAEKIGWLMGAAGVGALSGIVIAANLSRFRYRGWLLIGGAVFFGTFLILFAITSNFKLYELSMLMLFLADLCASIYLLMVMTTLQTLVPDQFRGRVMGFYSITWSMIPLGGLQASQVAHYINPPVAVAIGGALVTAFALGVALTSRKVRLIGAQTEEYQVI